MLARLNKPHFVFRPQQFPRRLSTRDPGEARLPWGLRIGFDPGEMHGSAILRTGLLDLAVSEALFRLTEPGARTVDAGANIGHMTSILALRAGRSGSVVAFEPHPATARMLRRNIARWAQHQIARVDA